jgi:hypothetical protein
MWKAAGVLVLGVLVLAGCSSAGSAPTTTTTTTPSAATKAAFVNAIHSDYPASDSVPDGDLSGLGGYVCGQLMSGKTIDSIAVYLGTQQKAKALPEQFIAALIVESPTYFCPS